MQANGIMSILESRCVTSSVCKYVTVHLCLCIHASWIFIQTKTEKEGNRSFNWWLLSDHQAQSLHEQLKLCVAYTRGILTALSCYCQSVFIYSCFMNIYPNRYGKRRILKLWWMANGWPSRPKSSSTTGAMHSCALGALCTPGIWTALTVLTIQQNQPL